MHIEQYFKRYVAGLGITLGFLTAYIAYGSLAMATNPGTPSRGDFPCIYNTTTTDNVLADGFGGAFACDKYGRILLSPSSTANVSFSGLQTFAGFLSTASSTVNAQLNVSGPLSVSSSLNVSGLALFLDGSQFNGYSYHRSPISVTNGTTTSTLTANTISIATSTTNLLGLFHVTSAGVVSASGTINALGINALGESITTVADGHILLGGGGQLRFRGATCFARESTGLNFSCPNQMYLSAGTKLGVGTSTPAMALGLQGNALFSGDLTLANLTATGTAIIGSTGNTGTTTIQMKSPALFGTRFIYQSPTSTANCLVEFAADIGGGRMGLVTSSIACP